MTQPTHLLLESRPSALNGAVYDTLPFPNMGATQEVAFDLGITARNGDVTLNGLVIKGYHDHQLLFEQRWPAAVLLARTGEADLTIAAGTGLAVRGMQFLLHGHMRLSHLEITGVAKVMSGENADESTQAVLQIPVSFPTQRTDLHFPLAGAWWTIQAADWTDQHKQEIFSQTYALDFVKLGADNRFFRGDGRTLEDHTSWDQPVFATAGGKVAYASHDMPDMLPGAIPDPRMFRDDRRRILGNAVAISHANGEFSYFAHLQQASIPVQEGEMIRRGTLIGRVGNSGSSPGPHLHFHLMDGPNLFTDKGLPAKFTQFEAGGQWFEHPTTIPTRMIVIGPERNVTSNE